MLNNSQLKNNKIMYFVVDGEIQTIRMDEFLKYIADEEALKKAKAAAIEELKAYAEEKQKVWKDEFTAPVDNAESIEEIPAAIEAGKALIDAGNDNFE